MSHQCLDTSPICGHTTYHEMLLKGTPMYIQTYIYIYTLYIYVYTLYIYMYISYILFYRIYYFFGISNTYTSTYTIDVWHKLHLDLSRAPWHLADLLLGGVPGQAEHVLGDAQKTMGGDEKTWGSSGFKAGKTMGKPGKAWGKWDFHPKTMEKNMEKVVMFDQNSKKVDQEKSCVATNRQKLRQHKLDSHCQGIQFPARALSNMTAAQTYYKFPKLDGSKLQYQTLPTWLDRWCPFTVPFWLSDSIQNTTNSVQCSWFGGQNSLGDAKFCKISKRTVKWIAYAHNYTWIHTNLYNDMKNMMCYHMKRHVIYDVYDVWHMIVWCMVCNIKTGMYGSVTNKTLESKQQRHFLHRVLCLLDRYCGAGTDSTSHATRNQPAMAANWLQPPLKNSNPGIPRWMEWSPLQCSLSASKRRFESPGMVAQCVGQDS